jgi:FdhD protein
LRAIKVRPDRHVELPEHVATEEPMQILVAGPRHEAAPLAVTMRTPGHDFELAVGFVVTEGVATRDEIASVDYCEAFASKDPQSRFNHVTVRLTRPWERPAEARYFAASASCGMCGKATIDQVETECQVLAGGAPFPAELILELPDRLRAAQTAFNRTGGLHAAGLFDRAGQLQFAREDVGRHNAVDKVVGARVLGARGPAPRDTVREDTVLEDTVREDTVLEDTVLEDIVLAVSGRVSFEIVQKAAMAGFRVIAAVSAPSSLAVDAAHRLGVTVAAFVRGDSYNVYSHPERITLSH